MAKEQHKNSGKRTGKSKPKDITQKKSFAPKGKPKPALSKPKKPTDEIRLNKYIANSGMCSRREADLYISTGNVTVNGKVINELGYKVKLTDEVKFDGGASVLRKKNKVFSTKPKDLILSAKNKT